MRYMKLTESFWNEIPVKRLRQKLGDEGVYALIKLVAWMSDRTRSLYDVQEGTEEIDIETAADWNGEQCAFISAACETGCLKGGERNKNGDLIPYELPPWIVVRYTGTDGK